eukprot:CAMPEP_0198139410 /NCGR_PEP_ID=MMETSP1443-20131203/2708_1 /TAXON_ID=186043 /ORGANISM="Entomoneis sp., Strain CCMP2396" /LENGTH=591 /DNA_ID=CAMNT_0043801527 /DNA_START=23 /DNA_END=1798 /DNA_ORIENTATION=+
MVSSIPFHGWKATWGSSYEALALYRITLGFLLTLELVLRFRFLHAFYSDQGTLPLDLLMPKVDDLYKTICIHCHYGEEWQQQILLSIQVALAIMFMVGVQTRLTAFLSWFLYLSLTLRNPWMNYILDRYFHYLLLHAIFLPTAQKWTLFRKKKQQQATKQQAWVVSPATISLKLLLFWIYLDAGSGKLLDPLGGWSYSASPLPALDTYTRHTTAARYVYALLGPQGLRVMTPIVVWVELLSTPVAMLGSYLGSKALTYLSITLICSLHVGIALTLNNSALLSFAACVPWCIFLPYGWKSYVNETSNPKSNFYNWQNLLAALCLGSMMLGSLWIDAFSAGCDQSVKHIWSTLLHNRWNVFVGAEEYVTWEIGPGLLADGSVVDVWGRSEQVNWAIPGSGAPCTSTARPGRWRSFPYLAELEGAEGQALWGYLCEEWDRENKIDQFPGRQLIKFNFFMLQADVMPNMTFSATRKRLIHTQECVSTETTPAKGMEESVIETGYTFEKESGNDSDSGTNEQNTHSEEESEAVENDSREEQEEKSQSGNILESTQTEEMDENEVAMDVDDDTEEEQMKERQSETNTATRRAGHEEF